MSESSPDGAWRALEDQPRDDRGAGREGSGSAPASIRGSWAIAALALASLIAAAAIWIVVSGSRGSLVVEGAGPGPGRPATTVAGLGPVSEPSATTAPLVVDVQGAVLRPGLVRLAAGSRVADAIAAAGGYGPRVAADRIGQALNLAALVKDGDQVVVPSREDPVSGHPPGGGSAGDRGTAGSGATGPIDLNRATATELDALPGIGPVTAAKIVAARDEQAFVSVDDLKTRKILGAATFDKVKDLVVVR